MPIHENNNPYDSTVWDPFDPERAIEDHMHGPSAVHDLLTTPPMPLGNGTYYQPGGYYAVGTVYFDAKGQPVRRAGNVSSMLDPELETRDVHEWIEAS